MNTIDERIEATKLELQQSQNQLNLLMNKRSDAERKERTHRLIERGAVLERILKGSEKLTTEQVQVLLTEVFSFPEAQGCLSNHGLTI